uniref:Uncharacterized protein n=1 Tax=Anopheles melas TaxID=34690 RepID=A0A182TPT9_9DIPT
MAKERVYCAFFSTGFAFIWLWRVFSHRKFVQCGKLHGNSVFVRCSCVITNLSIGIQSYCSSGGQSYSTLHSNSSQFKLTPLGAFCPASPPLRSLGRAYTDGPWVLLPSRLSRYWPAGKLRISFSIFHTFVSRLCGFTPYSRFSSSSMSRSSR